MRTAPAHLAAVRAAEASQTQTQLSEWIIYLLIGITAFTLYVGITRPCGDCEADRVDPSTLSTVAAPAEGS